MLTDLKSGIIVYGLLHTHTHQVVQNFFHQEFRIFVRSQRISLLKTVDMWFAVSVVEDNALTKTNRICERTEPSSNIFAVMICNVHRLNALYRMC